MYAVLGTLLNQYVFLVLLIGATSAACLRRNAGTVALVFFAAGYLSTQIPLLLGMQIAWEDRLFLQALVSIGMVYMYWLLPITRPLVVAMLCECALIAVNILTLAVNLHEWWHWMLFGVINYTSFISLCINKWGPRRERAPLGERKTPADTFDHVYHRARANLRKGSGIVE